MEPGLRSIRAIAAATGIAKSSVHRLVQAIERRHQYPESPLGTPEATSGYTDWSGQWCMFESRGIGNETLSEFFHILHLEGYRCFPNALQTSANRAADSELPR